jgi:hypothetical protein
VTILSTLTHRTDLPVSAVQPQPRRHHQSEVWAHTPTVPWGSRRLPRTLLAGDQRRTLFRTLLRHSEGVPVEFADGTRGTVEDVVLPALGFDFWAEELIVATPNRCRLPVRDVLRLQIRPPKIEARP